MAKYKGREVKVLEDLPAQGDHMVTVEHQEITGNPKEMVKKADLVLSKKEQDDLLSRDQDRMDTHKEQFKARAKKGDDQVLEHELRPSTQTPEKKHQDKMTEAQKHSTPQAPITATNSANIK